LNIYNATLESSNHTLAATDSRIVLGRTQFIGYGGQGLSLLSSNVSAFNATFSGLPRWAFIQDGSVLSFRCQPRCALDGDPIVRERSHLQVIGVDSTGSVTLEDFSTGSFSGTTFARGVLCTRGSDAVGHPGTNCPSAP